MAKPPEDIGPSELFLKLKEAPPSEVVPFPRMDSEGKPIYHVRIRVLREEDRQRALRLARESIKRHKLTPEEMDTHIGRTMQNDAVQKELIAMACLEAENSGDMDPPFYRRIFTGGADLDVLTPHELMVLFNQYEVTQAKFGPLFNMMNDENELSFWLKRLQEGAEEHPLLQLGLPELVLVTYRVLSRHLGLCRLLDSQLENLPESLAARLLPLEIGTGFYGRPASTTTASSSAMSLDNEELVGAVSPEELKELVKQQALEAGLDPEEDE